MSGKDRARVLLELLGRKVTVELKENAIASTGSVERPVREPGQLCFDARSWGAGFPLCSPRCCVAFSHAILDFAPHQGKPFVSRGFPQKRGIPPCSAFAEPPWWVSFWLRDRTPSSIPPNSRAWRPPIPSLAFPERVHRRAAEVVSLCRPAPAVAVASMKDQRPPSSSCIRPCVTRAIVATAIGISWSDGEGSRADSAGSNRFAECVQQTASLFLQRSPIISNRIMATGTAF